MRKTYRSILWGSALALAIAGCGNHVSGLKNAQADVSGLPNKARGTLPVQADISGLPEKALQGTFLYLKSVSDIRYPGKAHQDDPAGIYLDSGKVVQFQIKNDTLTVVAIEPKLGSHGKENPIVASFPIRHRAGGNIEIDLTRDAGDSYAKDSAVVSVVEGATVDPTTGAIRFTTERLLNDDTVIDQRYSFRPAPESNFAARPYPREDQNRFGFFKTTVYHADRFDRITRAGVHEYLNHWDTTKPITYYLSKNFPTRLEPVVEEVFAAWNEVFEKAVGRRPLRWERNSGQEPGDLRYSMIVYNDEPSDSGILGYGPQWTDPRTGQILKADVFLFGGTFRKELFSERVWVNQLGTAPAVTSTADESPLASLALLKASPGTIDSELLSHYAADFTADRRNPFSLESQLQSLRQSLDTASSRETTRINLAARLSLASRAASLSEDELERRIFQPVLAHELGHTFGLRHNFEASADLARFPEKGNTTSEMDYPLLNSEDPGKPGPYDEAAILYGYSDDAKKRGAALASNFLYCGDADLMSLDNALCNQHDSGTNLTEVVRAEANLYQTSYLFNNHRLDRVTFSSNAEAYRQATLQHLLPLRLAYENADSILSTGGNLRALWAVTHQRIEADAKSDPRNIVKLTLKLAPSVTLAGGEAKLTQPTVTRLIDKAKIGPVLRDAYQAKQLAYQAMEAIVLEAKRPEGSVNDIDSGDLQVRGVLIDKLIALQLLAAPLGSSSPFNTMEDGRVAQLLSSLISNTRRLSDDKSPQVLYLPAGFNLNLRLAALDLVANKLAKPGSTAHAREMLRVDSVPISAAVLGRAGELKNAVDEALGGVLGNGLAASAASGIFPGLALPFGIASLPANVELAQARGNQQRFVDSLPLDTRVEMENLLRNTNARGQFVAGLAEEMMVLASGAELNAKMQTELANNEARMLQARSQFPIAYTVSGARYWKASLANNEVESAAGHLIRDNINIWEDRLAATRALTGYLMGAYQAEKKKPEPDADTLQQITDTAATIDSLRTSFTAKLATERQLLERIQRYYQPASN